MCRDDTLNVQASQWEHQIAERRLVDLSHVLGEGMPVHPGLPAPVFAPVVSHRDSRARYQGQAEFNIGKVEMPGNVGTYLDAPFHRFSHLEDLSRIPLEAVVGLHAFVVDVSVSPRALAPGLDNRLRANGALLFRTGWDSRWGKEDYWEQPPYLAEQTVEKIVRMNIRLLGVDFGNIDDASDNSRPAHTRLLREGILVVENLCNLAALPEHGFRFFAVPPRIHRGSSFPIRAFAEVPSVPTLSL